MDSPADTPARIGRYEVVAPVRTGRLFSIFRVRQPGLARELALKTQSPDASPAHAHLARRGLRREAEIRASVEHPALLPLFDRGRHQGAPYVVGPWLAGGALAEAHPRHRSVARVLAIAATIGAGLDALHAAGWTHGDVSPGNILFDREGRPHLADLASCVRHGARWLDRDGAPRWMVTRLTGAPEIWRGDRVDGRADLYALAIILYHLLTGAWPFLAAERQDIAALHVREPPAPPSTRRRELGPAVDAVLLRALAKDPAARFASGDALADALADALGAAAPDLLPRRRRAGRSDTAAVQASDTVARFAAALPAEERQAFAAVLAELRRREGRARATLGTALRGQIAPLAALAAAEEIGLLDALALGPASPAALALAVACPQASVERLCQLLRSGGWLTRSGDTWALVPLLADVYGPAGRLHGPSRPVAHALTRWGGLARWTRTLTPPAAMDRDADGRGYVDSVANLAVSFGDSARELAAALAERGLVPDRPRILDVGAGSAVWSLALAEAWPEAVVTAVDRARVLEVAAARAAELGLAGRFTPLAGDWEDVPLAPASHDLVIAANLCHLLDPRGLVGLIRRLADALAPAGRVVIIDTIPPALATAPAAVIYYDVELALRSERGQVHDAPAYAAALAAADLTLVASWTLERRGFGLQVLVAASTHAG